MAKRKYAAAAEAADALLARYGATEHAPAAKAIREKLDSNPEVGRALREQKAAPEAQRLLRVAESYTRNRMPQKALATYKQIAEKFPGTSFAGTARSRIRSLGGN